VTEHRHKLLRGLRWWVDAVVDPDERRFVVGLGDSPARMCALLLANVGGMADEDQDTLRENLWEWVGEAMPMVGKVSAPVPALPREALDQRVPVHVAAKALGVSVSTVKRRTPDTREAGTVLLREAAGPLCVLHDLPPAWCAHCRGDDMRSVPSELA
jgi:hypothetical protein